MKATQQTTYRMLNTRLGDMSLQLEKLRNMGASGKKLTVASDDPTYQTWTMRVVPEHPLFQWTAQGPDDWRNRWADACPTRYEQKAVRCGRTPMYFSFARKPRSA